MKKLLSVLLVFTMLFGLGMSVTAQSETEIPEGYTPVYTAEDLNNIRNNLSGKYILMNDIDLSVYENWEPIGTQEAPFTGELDGNGYLIRNMKIEKVCSEEQNYIGLFGVVKDVPFNSVIIENGNISVSEDLSVQTAKSLCVGMLVGKLIGEDLPQFRNCSSEGIINISGFSYVYAGGFAGCLRGFYSVVFSSNYTALNIKASSEKQVIYAAGFIGSKDLEIYPETNLWRIANFGDISFENENCSEESEFFAAGIMNSQFVRDDVSDCLNKGDISFASSSGQIMIGGIIGDCVSRIENCCNLGDINVPTDENDRIGAIGAFMGQLPSIGMGKSIFNCYYSNENTEPYFKEETDINSYGVNVVYVPETEIYKQDSFEALDFEKIWEIDETEGLVLTALPVINVKETLNLETGSSANIRNGKAYSTSDDSIVTVNENGEVVALSAGEAVITVEIEYGYNYEYTVTVTEPEPEPPVEEPTDPTPPVEEPDEPDTPDEPDKPDNSQECYLIKVIRQLWSSFKWAVIAIFDTIFRLF